MGPICKKKSKVRRLFEVGLNDVLTDDGFMEIQIHETISDVYGGSAEAVLQLYREK